MTQQPPDEHQRFARYLRQLTDVHQQDEAELVRTVLRDPDPVMAQSAVVRYLDRRAAQFLTSPAALRLLAGEGRTRRVRTTADRRLTEQRR
ncbi:hypothetical protein ACGFJC_00970 [Nonomuraea fuscirosea]|uniref:hypothetical protein n=1 Tax=Nonomuraea fuscirosea TaxID=1291556 RepID=UPI0034220096